MDVKTLEIKTVVPGEAECLARGEVVVPDDLPSAKTIRKFWHYWISLRLEGKFLPIKPDGTVHRYRVAEEAGFGEAALRQNLTVVKWYEDAVKVTLEAHRRLVEARLAAAQKAGAADADKTCLKSSPADAENELPVSEQRKREKVLRSKISELEQKLLVIQIELEAANKEIQRLKPFEQEAEQARRQSDMEEFQSATGMNPGPY